VKLGLALRELHRAEKALAHDLLRLSDRHRAEHEIHHVARDLAAWSRTHVHELAGAGERYGLRLDDDPSERSGPLAPLRTKLSELTGHRAEPGMLLLSDLRGIHRAAAGVSLDWELLAQGAQAVRDGGLLALSQRCHPRTLRQLTWSNAMLKTLAPQILAS
jgi:hypothetical protein